MAKLGCVSIPQNISVAQVNTLIIAQEEIFGGFNFA
jgi:hypothetical protein